MLAALNRGRRVKGQAKAPILKEMRRKLHTAAGRQLYAQREGIVEGPFGTLKVGRHMQQFRLRGLVKVNLEFMLGVLGYNLTRLHPKIIFPQVVKPSWVENQATGGSLRTTRLAGRIADNLKQSIPRR